MAFVRTRSLAPLISPHALEHRRDGGIRIIPCGRVTCMHYRLRTVRVPELQNGRLREDIRGSETGWMLRIAFNFGRPAHLALYEHPLRKAVAQQARGKVSRQAIHLSRRRIQIRNDLTLGRVAACADSCQGKRGRHELEEAAAIERERLGDLRLLSAQPLQKLFAFRQFLQAAPKHRPPRLRQTRPRAVPIKRRRCLQRWHIEQSVSRRVSMS